MIEQVLREAIKLWKDGKAKNLDEALEMAKEMLGGRISLQETITGMKFLEKEFINQRELEKEEELIADFCVKIMGNAIAYLENAYEDEGQEKDLSKGIYILQQKDKLKTSNFIDKLDEEVFEFKDALMNGDRENQFEEILDIFQIAVTIMAEVIKPTDRELLQAISAHNEKLLVDRQYKTKGMALKFLFEE